MKTRSILLRPARGSITVEACLVTPFMVLMSALLIGLFGLMITEVKVNKALHYAARTAAASAQKEDSDTAALTVMAVAAFEKEALTEHIDSDLVVLGLPGVSLLESDLSGEYVQMKASYFYKMPIRFFGIGNLPVNQQVCARKWVGAGYGEGDGDVTEAGAVYITPNGEAYHSSLDCPYLNLSIHTVSEGSIKDARNKDGGKYYKCGCYKGGDAYITDYGTQYHGSLECGDLKRTITSVSMEEAEGRHPCSGCCHD